MLDYIRIWTQVLRDADPAWGLPLLIIGLMLMFLGWQFHRVAVPFTYLQFGLLAGILISDNLLSGILTGLVVGGILAAASYFLLRGAVALLGGLCGCFAVAAYMSALPSVYFAPVLFWSCTALGFFAGNALAFVLYKETGMLITSFVGALLFVSGLNGMMPQYLPTLYRTIVDFLSDYPSFLVPFLVGAPTIIGTLFQMSSDTRQGSGAI